MMIMTMTTTEIVMMMSEVMTLCLGECGMDFVSS